MFFFVYSAPRCTFIRIRKTGSTSIVRGMLADVPPFQIHETFPEGEAAGFCFAMVRHPVDRLVSAYRMFRQYKRVASEDEVRLRDELTLDRVLDLVEDETAPVGSSTSGFEANLKLHALPMTDERYQLHRAEFIGRFEHYERDYRTIADRLGVSSAGAVAHMRQPKPGRPEVSISVGTRARILRLYGDDFERCGYDA